MSIRVTCPDCKNVLTVADGFRGMQIQCQHCAEMVQVGDKVEEKVEEPVPTPKADTPPTPPPAPKPRPVQAARPQKPAPKPQAVAPQRPARPPRPARARTEERAQPADNDLSFDDIRASRPQRGQSSAGMWVLGILGLVLLGGAGVGVAVVMNQEKK